jgi:hypothetical protein
MNVFSAAYKTIINDNYKTYRAKPGRTLLAAAAIAATGFYLPVLVMPMLYAALASFVANVFYNMGKDTPLAANVNTPLTMINSSMRENTLNKGLSAENRDLNERMKLLTAENEDLRSRIEELSAPVPAVPGGIVNTTGLLSSDGMFSTSRAFTAPVANAHTQEDNRPRTPGGTLVS